MRKLLLVFICILSLSSCTKISYFEIDNISSVKLQKTTMTGIETLVDVSFVANKQTVFWIKRAKLEVSLMNDNIGTVYIPDKVRVMTNGSCVKIPLNIDINGGILGAFSTLSRINKHIDEVMVSGVLVVRKGFVTKRLKIKNIPLSELYDVRDIQEMSNFLNI